MQVVASMASKKKLVASYIFDCLVLILFAAIGGGFSLISPSRRLFQVTDPTIAYPNLPDTVSVAVLFLVAVVAPAAIVCVVTLFFVTRRSNDGTKPNAPLQWRRKLWELFAGLLGLAFAVILGFFLTQAAKSLWGKPRPDFLARCRPDLVHYAQYVDGGFTSEVLEGTSVHVRYQICQTINGTSSQMKMLDDGFRSFPSGHCTIAFAGLVYLSLFLAAKFSAAVPFLSPNPDETSQPHNISSSTPQPTLQPSTNPRSKTAAPPIYLFVLVFAPTAVAIYIASTRFKDYKHHGFDVFFSSVEGTICAWLAFRWYHMPVRHGAGWAWGPRSNDRAFGIRIGVGSYHDSKKTDNSVERADELPSQRNDRSMFEDIELGDVDRRGTSDSTSSRAYMVRAEGSRA